MYGTTMKSFNEKGSRKKDKEKKPSFFARGRKNPKVQDIDIKDTTYMKIDMMEETTVEAVVPTKKESIKDVFSFKDFPIASVVITAIITMLMIVLSTGFNM